MLEPEDVGVIWDMDGTLVASATVVPDAFIETVIRLGATPPDRAGVVALYDVGDPRAMLGRMLEREGTVEDADLYHAVLRGMTDQVRVHDGIGEVLAELRGRGLPQAVFTGNSHQAAEAAGAMPVQAGWGHLYDDALGHPTADSPAEVLAFLGRLTG